MKMSRFLPMQKGDTVLNYYVLPLISKSRKDFGSTFITTKVDKEGVRAFVQVKTFDIYPDTLYTNKVEYQGNLYLFYKIPKKYISDVRKIIKGQYSKISSKAKYLIIKNSGLVFNEKSKKGTLRTSKLLFALTKDETLIEFYFDKLKSKIDKYDKRLYKTLSNTELMEKVDESDFM